jgi:pimeloyl-ACP methyl ester carboxylesterase
MISSDDGRYVDIGGLKTFYIKKGDGYPLVLLHGSAPGACTVVSWKRNIEFLANAGFAVYAFDQPGSGLTDNPADFSMEYKYRHAKLFIDKMALDRFHMIANSQGAYFAARMGLEDRRVQKLVFTASGTVSPKGSAEAQALSKQHGEELAGFEPTLENTRALTQKTLFHKELVDDDLVKLRYEMSIGKNYEAQIRKRKLPSPQPITEELRNLPCETLLLWGKNDHGVALERGVLLFQLLPHAELHVFDRCGHWCQWDQAARFHDLVANFLK